MLADDGHATELWVAALNRAIRSTPALSQGSMGGRSLDNSDSSARVMHDQLASSMRASPNALQTVQQHSVPSAAKRASMADYSVGAAASLAQQLTQAERQQLTQAERHQGAAEEPSLAPVPARAPTPTPPPAPPAVSVAASAFTSLPSGSIGSRGPGLVPAATAGQLQDTAATGADGGVGVGGGGRDLAEARRILASSVGSTASALSAGSGGGSLLGLAAARQSLASSPEEIVQDKIRQTLASSPEAVVDKISSSARTAWQRAYAQTKQAALAPSPVPPAAAAPAAPSAPAAAAGAAGRRTTQNR